MVSILASQAKDASSILVSCSIINTSLAQLVEQQAFNLLVMGSSPIRCTNNTVMVAVAQLVERWIVIPDVVGLSPISHPTIN